MNNTEQINIPSEVKERLNNKKITLEDLINYKELQKIKIEEYIDQSDPIINFFKENYGIETLQELIKKHEDVFKHIAEKKQLHEFSQCLKKRKNAETSFITAVKDYFTKYGTPSHFRIIRNGETLYNPPEWISSMNFEFKEHLGKNDDLLNYNNNTFILYEGQRKIIDNFGIDNVLKFEKETGFFTYQKYSRVPLEMLEAVKRFFEFTREDIVKKSGIDFKDGNLSYEDFKIELASCLDYMRKNNIFVTYQDYDWIQGEFRDEHPEIFIDKEAPAELKAAFYKNKITSNLLYEHPEYIEYLKDKNLNNTLFSNIKLLSGNIKDERGRDNPFYLDFIEEYTKRYGNENLLQLIAKYGRIIDDITVNNLNNEIDDQQALESNFKKAIYDKIMNSKLDYSYLSNVEEMSEEYPELFIDFSNITGIPAKEKERLYKAFYKREMEFDDIKKYPELANYLKDKNLYVAFGDKDGEHKNGRIYKDYFLSHSVKKVHSDLELLEILGNEDFLKLCQKYGRYMDGIIQRLNEETKIKDGKYYNLDYTQELNTEDISEIIENIIVQESINGNIRYYPEDAPSFLLEGHPELFLDEDAPQELKNYFYNYDNRHQMSFHLLKLHKEWMPYLKDKPLKTALLKNHFLKYAYEQAYDLFGEEKLMRIGISRAETVEEMMRSDQVELLKKWYDKTGGRFVPDYVVMQNFDIEEADKFLEAGRLWSKLMKIEEFARLPEGRDVMIKLGYSFGVFDHDQRGFKKLEELLTNIPKQLTAFNGHTLSRINDRIDSCTQRKLLEEGTQEDYYNTLLEKASSHKFNDIFSNKSIVKLLKALKEENVEIDYSKPLFTQLYKKKDDGTYILIVNQQSYPKTVKAMRKILKKFVDIPILTPAKAHTTFGAFELKYDPAFRDFMLDNAKEVINNPRNNNLIPSIQKQFSDILAANSNRTLTWDLAISFVETNRFTDVNVGNERLAEVCAHAGYTQRDFDILQLIYNYGKQRTYSSIPRKENKVDEYSYEILRLDDPNALTIGTESDCCYELNNCAELSNEHGMVSPHGRVFSIRDEEGRLISQSWVWRNKDVICFDNIEIPKKVIAKAKKDDPISGRKKLSKKILDIYKKAAHKMMEEDERVYKELLESGKITEKQYQGLRLGKVTVGLGHNDIAEAIEENTEKDKEDISRPLPFKAPVPLKRGLYTSDSVTQHVLEKRDDRIEYEGETLAVHRDDYIEYTDSNFSETLLNILQKLEIETKDHPNYLETASGNNAEKGHIVSEIAYNYRLNPEITKIVMNPNFAIIYEDRGEAIKIGDLLYNKIVKNEGEVTDIEQAVIVQMKQAIDQIASGKEVDLSSLKKDQIEMYEKAINLDEELDIERGVGRAR